MIMTASRRVVALVLASIVTPTAPVWALCPNCLGQNRALSPTLELLGAFLLVPFVVGFFVLRAIRRALR